MAKLKVQAQHLQPGDIVGSGEKVSTVIVNSTAWPNNKCMVTLYRTDHTTRRHVLWGKYIMIGVKRDEDI